MPQNPNKLPEVDLSDLPDDSVIPDPEGKAIPDIDLSDLPDDPEYLQNALKAMLEPLLPAGSGKETDTYIGADTPIIKDIWPGGIKIPGANEIYEGLRPLSSPLNLALEALGVTSFGKGKSGKLNPIPEAPPEQLKPILGNAEVQNASRNPRTGQVIIPGHPNSNAGIPELNIVSPGESPTSSSMFGMDTVRRIRDRIMGNVPKPEPKLVDPNIPVQPPSPQSQAVRSIIDRLKAAGPMNDEQRAMYKQEHAERAGEIEGLKSGGMQRHYDALGKLKGQYGKVPDFQPLTMNPQDEDMLLNMIYESPNLGTLEKVGTAQAYRKLVSGKIPTRSELAKLEMAFNSSKDDLQGSELVSSLLSLRPKTTKTYDEFNALSKTMMSGMDMSAPLRQGLPLMHKKAFWTSLDDMFKAWGSEEAATAINETIIQHPLFKEMRKSGLSLTDSKSMANQEEAFTSRLAGQIPGIKHSARAYSAFLNKLRSDSFASLYNDALEVAPKDPRQRKMYMDDAALKISDYVNTATGRGKLKFGKLDLEGSADALNQVFFAPRFAASRLQMVGKGLNLLNPKTFIDTPAYIRRDAIKSALTVVGAVGFVNTLGALAGGKIKGDFRSSDAGKVKFGDTRIDPGAGYLQPLVLAYRIISGSTMQQSGKTTNIRDPKYGQPDVIDLVTRYLRSKLGPNMSMIVDRATGADQAGNRLDNSWTLKGLESTSSTVAQRFAPMFIQDVYDVMKDDKDWAPLMQGKDPRALAAIPASFFGMGSQTYGR